jgi:protein-S-isoprenylcysteine O-methyltransferase Ste14
VQDPVGRIVLRGLFAFGWGLLLLSTFLINHFDLFGLRQVWLYLTGRPNTALRFVTPGPYRLVRHPLYVGWLFAFWMTPVMTLAHLLFSVLTTAYILVAIQFEERDLIRDHGERYKEYRRSVPMLIPFGKRGSARRSGLVKEEQGGVVS